MSDELQNSEVIVEKDVAETSNENNSGQGPKSQVPDVVAKRFNWGACVFGFIWCLFYKQYMWAIIYIICNFIPLAGLGCSVFFGIKGNSWAWQAKKYKSVDEFHTIHKKWAYWAVAGAIIFIWAAVARMTIPTLLHSTEIQKQKVGVKKSMSVLSQGSQLLQSQGEKIKDFSSESLTNYYTLVMNAEKLSQNSLKTEDNFIYTFVGDGSCKTDNCYVQVDINGEAGPNKEWLEPDDIADIVKIPVKNGDNYVLIGVPGILNKPQKQ